MLRMITHQTCPTLKSVLRRVDLLHSQLLTRWCLVCPLQNESSYVANVIDQLSKLHSLLEKGGMPTEQYNALQKAILTDIQNFQQK